MQARLVRVVVAIALVAVGEAGADESEAKIQFQAGVLYYEKGQYAKALEQFEEAYRVAQKPALLYNMAQCTDKLGDDGKTIEHLRRYIESGPEEKERQAAQAWLDNVEKRHQQAAPAEPANRAPPEATTAAPTARSSPAEREPWYGKWWAWGAGGAVVVGAVVAILVISAGGDGDATGDTQPLIEVPGPE